MSDANMGAPRTTPPPIVPSNPPSNLPPLSGFPQSGTGGGHAGIHATPHPQAAAHPEYAEALAYQGEHHEDSNGGGRGGLNAPRLIGLLLLVALIGLFAWLIANRGDGSDATDTDNADATEQVAEGDAGGDAMDDDTDAMADDDATSDDADAMADDDGDGDAMADDADAGGDAMADDADAGGAGSVVDTMLANRDLSIVIDGIGQLGLDQALSGEGPFTILAPTNDAFFLVSEDEASRLLGAEDNAATVLGYHVLQGNFSAENFLTALEAQGGSLTIDSLTGEPISVELVGEQIVLNGNSVVIDADQTSTNGLVHTISELIIPPSLETR